MVLPKLIVFLFVFLLCSAMVVDGAGSNVQVAKVIVRYKTDIILFCGEGDQDQEVLKKKAKDNEDDDDDDDENEARDGEGEDEDDEDHNGKEESEQNLWKDVQFFRALPKPVNASASDPGMPFEIIDPDGKKYKFDSDSNTLTIHEPKRIDIESSYSCNSSSPEKTIFFEFLIKPYLYMPEYQSYSHFEGEDQLLQCKALFGFEGGEALEWKWKFGKTLLQSNATLTIETNKTETFLHIKNLTEADRGNYKCIVSNKYGSHARTIKLRIKDKLAFLWPLIGIIAILVLVILIIVVTEAIRKAKEKKQRSD